MKPSEMRNDHVSDIGIEIDWSEYGTAHIDDTWFWEAMRCEECNKLVVLSGGGGGDEHRTFEETKCRGYVPTSDGPMMNFWYPCDIKVAEDAAKKIVNLPLCVVEVDDTRGLALTGGGMDMTWEICEAYMRLGYLPPAHYAGNLPAMCGRGAGKRDRWIMQACRRSVKIQIGWAKRGLERIAEAKRFGEEYERKHGSH